MARRQHVTLMFALAVVILITLSYMLSSSASSRGLSRADIVSARPGKGSKAGALDLDLPSGVLTGGAIAPKLENATAKAELGRAAWKLLHTMMARFPEKPTADESLALKTYITLFSRLYPCGDCARHFQQLLAKYPPQTSGRQAAAGWACFVHNEVNKRLKKPEFDCNNLDAYDCGCGDDDNKGKQKTAKGEKEETEELKGREKVSLEKEGLTSGG